MWGSNTKPTAANIRKRIDAAIEAAEAAITLAEQHGGMPKAIKEIGHASAWLRSARCKATGRGK
jgi:hypothetical protein